MGSTVRKKVKKLWGARFATELHPVAQCFSYSLVTDYELLDSEIEVSIAHATMLGNAGIIAGRDARTIVRGLKQVGAHLKRSLQSQEKVFQLAHTHEDIHSLIQSSLEKKVGKLAKKLHTGRSRNDLVATSMRLYVRHRLQKICDGLNRAQMALVHQAEKNQKIVIPGYTHLQRAQVVLMAHHFLAYVEMLERDKSRLIDARERFNECPLGAAALAGSNLPLDRMSVAKALRFKRPTQNSLDSVSDRDFVIEVLAAIAILFTHLSRFSEDLILWCSQEFGFIALGDEFSTGSSLMPHKKNPDILEIVRGKTGEACGNLTSILTTMKGIPLAYNRDMQEDKKPLFSSLKIAEHALNVLELTIKSITVDQATCARASKDSFLFATDVLDYLVKKKMAFREAHDVVGKLVRQAMESHSTLSGLSFEVYRDHSTLFQKDVYDLFDPEVSVALKSSLGSTKPDFVAKQIRRKKELLKSEASRLRRVRQRVAH